MPNGNYVASLRRIKRFMDNLHGREPREAEVDRLVPDLRTLFDKFSKIRRICPPSMSIDLSEDLWRLLGRAGVARREVAPLKRAQ
jgi:hypothetical protein